MPLLAKELITDEIPPLKLSDSGSKALHWMDEFKVSHLPIVKGREYLGLISEGEVLDMEDVDAPLGSGNIDTIKYFVGEGQHLFDVVKSISAVDLSVIPVLASNGEYLGIISLRHLMSVIANFSFVTDPGSTIVLEMNVHDYHLAELARIVESEDARVLGVFVSSNIDSTRIEVTIKVNTQNVRGIIQSFERFNYTIKASFDQGDYTKDMKNRFDEFMNFLKI